MLLTSLSDSFINNFPRLNLWFCQQCVVIDVSTPIFFLVFIFMHSFSGIPTFSAYVVFSYQLSEVDPVRHPLFADGPMSRLEHTFKIQNLFSTFLVLTFPQLYPLSDWVSSTHGLIMHSIISKCRWFRHNLVSAETSRAADPSCLFAIKYHYFDWKCSELCGSL